MKLSLPTPVQKQQSRQLHFSRQTVKCHHSSMQHNRLPYSSKHDRGWQHSSKQLCAWQGNQWPPEEHYSLHEGRCYSHVAANINLKLRPTSCLNSIGSNVVDKVLCSRVLKVVVGQCCNSAPVWCTVASSGVR